MSGKYDEVDPRVEWAMKVLDSEGQIYESQVEKLLPPVLTGLTPAIANLVINVSRKAPLHLNWMKALVTFPIGFGIAHQMRAWRDQKKATDQAVMKHYIMTHPELFPEPNRVKYIDYIVPWRPVRY